MSEVEHIKFQFGLFNSIETSAKTGENIDKAFEVLARDIYKNFN